MMTLHMVLFVEQFNLIEEKELHVLNDLIAALKQFKDSESNDGSGEEETKNASNESGDEQ